VNSKPQPFQRAPDGVVTGKPVLMRLMPAERAHLERLADAANSSLSNFARRMYRAGLTQFESTGRAKCVNGLPPAC